MAAWNAGDLDGWLDAHAPDAEYVTFAGPEPRTFAGHAGLREAWAEGRSNWEVFRFQVLDEHDGILEVGFQGTERLQGIQLSGVLWFRVQEEEGRLVRLWSALDAGDLP